MSTAKFQPRRSLYGVAGNKLEEYPAVLDSGTDVVLIDLEDMVAPPFKKEAREKTLREGLVTYWWGSRQELWTKGLTSGHTQQVEEIRIDCDLDCLLMRVRQKGGACHNGFRSCFYRRVEGGELVTDRDKVFDDDSVYGKTT